MILACLLAVIPTQGVHPAIVARAADRAEFVASVWPDEVPVDREFCRRVWRESHYRRHQVSSKGAVGLTQVLPRTARAYCKGLKWRTDPTDNIRCGWFLWSKIYGRSHRAYTTGRKARS